MAPNLLERRFEAALPNQRWVGNTTELYVGDGGRFFLAAILDLHSRFHIEVFYNHQRRLSSLDYATRPGTKRPRVAVATA